MPAGRKYRVLVVASHPVQYIAPLFRLMAQRKDLDLLVAYCTLQGAEQGKDPEFGIEVAWDIPLLEGYNWVYVPNRAPRPSLGKSTGLINPGLWRVIRRGGFDVLVVHGYLYWSFWIAMLAAKRLRMPVVMGTDAIGLQSPRGGWWWRKWVKVPIVKGIYRSADAVLVNSTASWQFLRSLGISEDRLALTPYAVDNEYFRRTAASADRIALRSRWGIGNEAPVILFCGKLIPWKRPQDVLQAFALVCDGLPKKGEAPFLIYAGEGPLRRSLESEAASLGVGGQVRFLGFINQSRLPAVYAASNLLVLPSDHEPWGLVVNEAMACGIPVVVSDRVGARIDLVTPGKTGEIYRVGDIEALAKTLEELVADQGKLRYMGERAQDRIATWSYRQHVEGFLLGVRKAVELRNRELGWA